MRIDSYLSEYGLVSSRTEAKRFIDAGAVFVNGKQITKASFDVLGDEDIRVDRSAKEFVSRGGLKLKGAIAAFGISVADKMCLDIGASSGGFTDCLLQRGAQKVYAVDAGVGQLAKSLLANPAVVSIEKLNARNLVPEHIGNTRVDLIVMDVSFISATYIIPQFPALMTEEGEAVCLVKPQFEVGRAMIGKGGIVRDKAAHADAIKRVCAAAQSAGLFPVALIPSPIEGGDGNREFLLHLLRKDAQSKVLSDQQISKVTIQ